jgi:hypothetical protein
MTTKGIPDSTFKGFSWDNAGKIHGTFWDSEEKVLSGRNVMTTSHWWTLSSLSDDRERVLLHATDGRKGSIQHGVSMPQRQELRDFLIHNPGVECCLDEGETSIIAMRRPMEGPQMINKLLDPDPIDDPDRRDFFW